MYALLPLLDSTVPVCVAELASHIAATATQIIYSDSSISGYA
jgi:hypothetical protein